MRKKFKKLLQLFEDDWVFQVDLMLDDFKDLQKKVAVLEEKVKELEGVNDG